MNPHRHMIKPRTKRPDSWQVIYMDMMTIVMVFFVILWTLNQGKKDGISDTIGDMTSRMINLPGDVIFSSGKSDLTYEGKSVFKRLFKDETGNVLNFNTSGLVKRMLFIHGHTDNDGSKEKNIMLGFERALAAYQEILQYNSELSNHVVLCTHADNSPEQEVPLFKSDLTDAQKTFIGTAKSKNRRITIEDLLMDRFGKK